MLDIDQIIAIGSDHAGFEYKEQLVKHLEGKGFQVKDMGVYENVSADYPDFAHPVAYAVRKERFPLEYLFAEVVTAWQLLLISTRE